MIRNLIPDIGFMNSFQWPTQQEKVYLKSSTALYQALVISEQGKLPVIGKSTILSYGQRYWINYSKHRLLIHSMYLHFNSDTVFGVSSVDPKAWASQPENGLMMGFLQVGCA